MGILAVVSGASSLGGEIVPMIKFNSVQGRLYRVERVQNPATGTWESEDHHLPLPIKFVADLGNMMIGPIAFLGGRPDLRLVRLADVESGDAEIPERPTPEHRIGFVVRIYNRTLGMREWRGLQKCVLNVMDAVYDRYKTSPEASQGLLPVLELTDVVAIKREGNFPGIDMAPVVRFDQWVPRPADLAASAVTSSLGVAGTNGAEPAVRSVSASMPPPARAAVPAQSVPRRAPPPPTRPSAVQAASSAQYLAPSSAAPPPTAPVPAAEAPPWDDAVEFQ